MLSSNMNNNFFESLRNNKGALVPAYMYHTLYFVNSVYVIS